MVQPLAAAATLEKSKVSVPPPSHTVHSLASPVILVEASVEVPL
jgi:hypothetical protein